MTMNPVLHSLAYCLDFLREQVEDVTEADMVAQPNEIKNHPAWTIGHIVFACQSIGRAIGLSHWLPRDWTSRFGTGSVPTSDAGVYGTKEDLLAVLRDAQSRLTEAVEQLVAAQLDQPFQLNPIALSSRQFVTPSRKSSSATPRITSANSPPGVTPCTFHRCAVASNKCWLGLCTKVLSVSTFRLRRLM